MASCALMMPGGAALARAYETRVEPPAPGGSHPHWPQMQKSLLIEQAFRIWSVIEDDSPLRGSPCGPLLTQRSLASLESNLSRSFSSFPMGQNIEYRRIIGLRCFLRRWWWGKDYSALKRLALRAVACGNVLSLRSSRTLVEASHPSPWGRI